MRHQLSPFSAWQVSSFLF
uniref:Uncharacterized protein n=1 Tax=Rhizophora mucronata TaxID=61149 RepID=A0A2P2LX56_RHIMU